MVSAMFGIYIAKGGALYRARPAREGGRVFMGYKPPWRPDWPIRSAQQRIRTIEAREGTNHDH
jgi:hypothetical protein